MILWQPDTRRRVTAGARNPATITGMYHAYDVDWEAARYASTSFRRYPATSLCGRPRDFDGQVQRLRPPDRGPLGGKAKVCPKCRAAADA